MAGLAGTGTGTGTGRYQLVAVEWRGAAWHGMARGERRGLYPAAHAHLNASAASASAQSLVRRCDGTGVDGRPEGRAATQYSRSASRRSRVVAPADCLACCRLAGRTGGAPPRSPAALPPCRPVVCTSCLVWQSPAPPSPTRLTFCRVPYTNAGPTENRHRTYT